MPRTPPPANIDIPRIPPPWTFSMDQRMSCAHMHLPHIIERRARKKLQGKN